jgi:hypothetical protein
MRVQFSKKILARELAAVPKNFSTALTFQSYREMISFLQKKGYSFLFFEEADLLLDQQKLIVLLRHDLDFDPELALPMAELEHQLGVRSTFFVLLTTQHYNFLTKSSRESIFRLLKLGHHIGLHFDALSHPISNEAEFNHWVRREADLLESVVEVPIKVVSFHRPHQKWLGSFRPLTQPLIHTYEPRFFSEIAYYSDSTGSWSHGPTPLNRKPIVPALQCKF